MCLNTLSYTQVPIPAQTLTRLPALVQAVCHGQVAIPEPPLLFCLSGRAHGWGCMELGRGCLAPWLYVGVHQQWPESWHCSRCRTRVPPPPPELLLS